MILPTPAPAPKVAAAAAPQFAGSSTDAGSFADALDAQLLAQDAPAEQTGQRDQGQAPQQDNTNEQQVTTEEQIALAGTSSTWLVAPAPSDGTPVAPQPVAAGGADGAPGPATTSPPLVAPAPVTAPAVAAAEAPVPVAAAPHAAPLASAPTATAPQGGAPVADAPALAPQTQSPTPVAAPVATPVAGTAGEGARQSAAAPTVQDVDAPVTARAAVVVEPVRADATTASAPRVAVEPAPSAPTVPVVAPAGAAQPTAAPAPSAPAAPPAPAPSLPEQLAPRIASLRSMGDGQHVMTMRVSPENLGPVRVVAHISGDTMRVELHGASEMAREALKVVLHDLRRDLAGIAGNATVDLGSSRNSGQNAQQGAQAGAGFGNESGKHAQTARSAADQNEQKDSALRTRTEPVSDIRTQSMDGRPGIDVYV